MVRDLEILRLTKYAEGLGLKVKFSDTLKCAAEWTTDGSEITISTKKNKSKIDIILSMIHELGHQTWFIHEKNRQPDLKFEEALDRQNLYEEDLLDTPAPKKLRRKIFNTEVAATKWWEVIYIDTGLKFPIWKLNEAKEFDCWQYEVYYETGHFPKKLQRLEKHKELKERLKPKKETL